MFRHCLSRRTAVYRPSCYNGSTVFIQSPYVCARPSDLLVLIEYVDTFISIHIPLIPCPSTVHASPSPLSSLHNFYPASLPRAPHLITRVKFPLRRNALPVARENTTLSRLSVANCLPPKREEVPAKMPVFTTYSTLRYPCFQYSTLRNAYIHYCTWHHL